MFGRISTKLDEYQADEFYTSEDITDHIGSGGFGEVRICWHRELGKVAAKYFKMNETAYLCTKRVLTTRLNGQVQYPNNYYREGATLARIDHPNIVKIYGYTICVNNFAYILEYVEGGNLDEYLKEYKQRIPWKLRLRFARQLISAINYLHNNSFGMVLVHGDIKPVNALLTFDRQLKLADFGAVNVYRDSNVTNENCILAVTEAHTPLYASPEFLLGRKVHSPGDIYSYAMVLDEIVTTQTVYHEQKMTMQQIAMLGLRPSEQDVMNASPQPGTEDQGIYDLLVNNMHNCWNQVFQNRPTASTILNELTMTKIGDYDEGFQWEEGPIDQLISKRIPLNEFFEPDLNLPAMTFPSQRMQPNMPLFNPYNPQQGFMPGPMQAPPLYQPFLSPGFMANGMGGGMYPTPSRSAPPPGQYLTQQQQNFWQWN